MIKNARRLPITSNMARVLRRILSERALALPFALLVMAISGAAIVTVVQFTSSSGRTATVATGRLSAEALAEAGLANAFAVLNNPSNNPTTSNLLGCNADGTSCTPVVSTYSGGTATWSGWLDSTGGSSKWRITSIGQVVNPTGGGAPALKVTLLARVPLQTTTGTPNASVWNYAYSTKPPGSGCEVDINGSNVTIDIPLYVTGDLCMSGSNSELDERGEGQTPAVQPIDLRVGGKLVMSGSNATVGKSSDYITSAAVQGGCTTTINGSTQTCARPPFNWYVSTVNTFEALTAPVADYPGWFAHNDTINSTSTAGGQDGDCDVRSGSPPAINPDTLLDADAGTVNLFGSTYVCRKTHDGTAGGTVVSELSWNNTTKVLTVKGAVFVDGTVNVSVGDLYATYNGSASLYVNGSFTLNGSNSYICANPSCNFATWNPNTEMLILVATSVSMNGSNVKYQGGLFCNPTSTADFSGSNVEIQGPIICGSFTFGSNTVFKPLPAITSLPIGAPVEPNVAVAAGLPVYGG